MGARQVIRNDEGFQGILPALPALLRQRQRVQLARKALECAVDQQRLQHGRAALASIAVVLPAEPERKVQALLIPARQCLRKHWVSARALNECCNSPSRSVLGLLLQKVCS